MASASRFREDSSKPERPSVSHQPPDTPCASPPSDLTSSSNHSTNYSPDHAHPKNSRPRIPSLSIRSHTSSISSTSSASSPLRRKPLPSTASPLAVRYSSGHHLATTPELPELPFVRPYSLDSPTLYEFPSASAKAFAPARSSTQSVWRQSDEGAASTREPQSTQFATNSRILLSPKSANFPVAKHSYQADHSLAKHARLASESTVATLSESHSPWYSDSKSTATSHSTMSMFSNKPSPPHQITLPGAPSRNNSYEINDSNANTQRQPPKSPGGSKLGSFFGWGGATSPASSTTNFSDKSYSPLPSPQVAQHNLVDVSKSNGSRNPPSAIDISRANAATTGYFENVHLQVPLATPTTPFQVEEMEKELKDISAELAASIRREMDLEDLVDRLQAEAQNPSGPGKRTSDYFSDSGTSSVKYGESDSRQDELDRMIRKTEQDKAQMKLELTDKVQEERRRRKQLESQIRTLEEKASQVDLVSINSLDANGRLRDLEATCEDLRRRLTEEKQVKDNFEDLLAALKGELQSSHNERDNLRDEIVPQLRARVEGLEAQAAEHERLTYEQSKMQQEVQKLKNENMSLVNAQRQQQLDMQQQLKKFGTISEEVGPLLKRSSAGLMRSNSVAQGAVSRSRPPSLTRSASVKNNESRDALAERVKDIESQRDALHRALKSLLERQEYQNRENQKRIRQLEIERDRALSSSPRRVGYDKEVSYLREEINTLRRRADEAIEQKWQCEKGLSGLKMDLDRAEEEIGSLRSLLLENDILLPTERRPSTSSRPGSSHATSESLERAYKDLQKAYSESLERVKNLETTGPKDDETESAMKQLEQSLADAISERNFAKQEADALRERSDSLRDAEKAHVSDELMLADELRGSARRVEELAIQVRTQLNTNSALRQRLSETIERGEKEQKLNAQKIMFMQSKLKSLEDQLMSAQQASEEKISAHEDELRDLRDSHNIQLQRMKEGLRSPRAFGAKTPISPMFANSSRAPMLLTTTSGKAMTVTEDSKMNFLEQRVVELESALADADKEMEEVVGRMNIAQIEVMELQNEREEAVRETKRLKKKIEEERVRAFEGRFATFAS